MPGPLGSLRIRVGVDIVGIDRVSRLVAENDGVVDTIFTEGEQEYCLGRADSGQHMAVRFAAKEAVLKAFGTGIGKRMRWTDVEILRGTSGRPDVRLHGEVAEWAARRGVVDVDVSLSHSAGLAIANAVAVWHEPEAA